MEIVITFKEEPRCMRKSNVIKAVYIIVGLFFLLLAVNTDSKMGSVFFGVAAACIIAGIVMICKHK